MATIELKIYKADNKNEVEKIHKVDSYDLMLGTIEDILGVVEVDKLNDKMAVANMVLKGYSQLKPFLKDVFPEVTDDELKRVKAKELVLVFMQIGAAIVESMDLANSGNLMRA